MVHMHTCIGLFCLSWLACFGLCLGVRQRGLETRKGCASSSRTQFDGVPPKTPQRHVPAPAHHSRSHHGPKSVGSRSMQRLLPFRAVHFWILLTFFVQLAVTPAVSARVSTVSTAVDEVTRHATSDRPIHQEAKPISGMHDIRARPVYQHARKRAYKRALLRAQRQGVTTYRGRTYTLQQLSGLSGLPDVTRQERGPKNSDNSGSSNRNVHPCLLSWNVGGLSNTILDELMIWLALPHNRCIKIVLLQETRWQFSSEWESESWFIIHAGHSKQKGAGVMTLISKDLCCADDIRSCEVASGRILHTRIPGAGGYNSLDIINTYQHAWDQRAEANELKRKRARIIEKVDSCLQQIPWRNLCICAGDWNVQLEPIQGLVGNSTTHRPGHRQSAPDAEVMVDLIVSKQLVAVNTWAGPRRRAYTFSHQGCHTQIDYVFVRRHQPHNRCGAAAPWMSFRSLPGGSRACTSRFSSLLITAGHRMAERCRVEKLTRMPWRQLWLSSPLSSMPFNVMCELHSRTGLALIHWRCTRSSMTAAFEVSRPGPIAESLHTTTRRLGLWFWAGGSTYSALNTLGSLQQGTCPVRGMPGTMLQGFEPCGEMPTAHPEQPEGSELTIYCMRLSTMLGSTILTNCMPSSARSRRSSPTAESRYMEKKVRSSVVKPRPKDCEPTLQASFRER